MSIYVSTKWSCEELNWRSATHTHTQGGGGTLSGELHRMTCPSKSAPYDSKNPRRLCSIMDHAQVKYIHKQIVPFVLRSNAPNQTKQNAKGRVFHQHASTFIASQWKKDSLLALLKCRE